MGLRIGFKGHHMLRDKRSTTIVTTLNPRSHVPSMPASLCRSFCHWGRPCAPQVPPAAWVPRHLHPMVLAVALLHSGSALAWAQAIASRQPRRWSTAGGRMRATDWQQSLVSRVRAVAAGRKLHRLAGMEGVFPGVNCCLKAVSWSPDEPAEMLCSICLCMLRVLNDEYD